MNEKVGNLEVLITKEASSSSSSSSSSYYGFNNVTVKLISLIRPIRNYESQNTDTISPCHRVKFENIPIGHYKVETSCKEYLNKSDFVHVKFSGADTNWNGHFRKSRNRKFLKIKKESGDTLSNKGAALSR